MSGPRSEEPRERIETLGALRIAWLEYGERGLPALILLHGMRDHAWSFDPLARVLAREHHVVVPHLRGHGDSDKPGSYAMADFLADLWALIERCGLERPVLLGHSLGGQIVLQFGGIFVDVPSAVISVEGLGPPWGNETHADMLRERIPELARGYPLRAPMRDLAAALERFAQRNRRLSAERARLLVERGTEPCSGGLRWKWVPEVQNVWTTFSRADTEERWRAIRCPVLVATAAESARYWVAQGLSTEADAARFDADQVYKLALFADAERSTLASSGHMVHYDQPEALLAVVRDFLARRLRAPTLS